ncbi:MAG TPA: glycosyltransferase family 2 protein [Candidatus Sulfotelmatobacter sp.]|jgi:N-acetylglucosaminyl-diphospho-decaprenol L-rhamnosyltransferase|nr:glycosyltransferase family 2 protein [Candidatus Sulfotelmatobacter sp.]
MVRCLDIVIVNWNAGKQLMDCVASIAASKRKAFDLARVIVVDNASSDGSVERLEEIALPVTIIRNAKNHGFAAACNQGAKGSRADYLLFLNPDVCVFGNSLAASLEFMQGSENASVGICGIQLVDAERRVIRSCARFPTVGRSYSKILGLDRFLPNCFDGHYLPERDHSKSCQVDQVMGAFFLVRRSVFEELNGFDHRFFVYFEDVDFSYRSSQVGWSSYYLTTAQAFHKGEGCTEQVRAARLFYLLRSRILYGYKHFGWPSATGLLAGTVLLEPFTRLAWAAWRGSVTEIIETLQAYARLWRTIPGLLWNRKRREKAYAMGGSVPDTDS